MRRFNLRQWLVLLLVLFSFFMSGFVSDRVFERLPHLEDEVAYLYQAKTYARGHLVIESPTPRRAFWQPFVVDSEGKRFGKYSPGWPALLMVGVWLGELWVVNAFFGALTVALVYRLGREVFNEDTGVIAAALTAFSPMALLLNASLMGHSSALFGATLFIYAYWRLEKRQNALRWGIIAGLSLGMVFASRPLTAIGLAIPFVAWSGVKLLKTLIDERPQFFPRLKPLLALSALTILLAFSIPVYSHAATGNPEKNLYTLVWSYDQIGFGLCCGRSSSNGGTGHNLEKGFRQARFDLSLMAADLFGWQIGRIDSDLVAHLQTEGDYWPLLGLSWVLLPFGLVVGFGRKTLWFALWLALGFGLYWGMMQLQNGDLMRDPTWSWRWMVVAYLWLILPTPALAWFKQQPRVVWTWLLASVVLSLIIAQLTYWIGSQRYSTRYYYETLMALAILSALPLAWLARRFSTHVFVYSWVALALVYSLYNYSTPRIMALQGYNNIHRAQVDAVQERRQDGRPVLVLVTGDDVRWRAFGSLMAMTSPYLDSDIVAAWDYGAAGVRDDILAQFPDRQVIEMQAANNDAWFKDEESIG
jgi:hypothetical protein